MDRKKVRGSEGRKERVRREERGRREGEREGGR